MSSVAIEVCCVKCSWFEIIQEPEGGQSLVGTAGERLAVHEGRTGHTASGKTNTNITLLTDYDGSEVSGGVLA